MKIHKEVKMDSICGANCTNSMYENRANSWKNQEALDEHHKSETINKIMELRNKYDLNIKVERYIIEDNIENDKNI